jgi:hypothetical protein
MTLKANKIHNYIIQVNTYSNILGNIGLTSSVAMLGDARRHISTSLIVMTMPSERMSDNISLHELTIISP